MMDKLDAAHRRHLRLILGYHRANHISNVKLYQEAQMAPLSLVTIKLRCQLFGHLLRHPGQLCNAAILPNPGKETKGQLRVAARNPS